MPFLSAILAVTVYGLMSPLLGVLLPTYVLTGAQQGALATANAVGLIVASIATGPLVDRRGSRAMLAAGLALMFLTLVLLPPLHRYSSLAAAFLLLGLCGGIVITSANALASSLAHTNRAGRLNFLNLFFGLGGILTTLSAAYLLTPASLCFSIGALAFVALCVSLHRASSATTRSSVLEWHQLPSLFARPILPLISLLLFFYVACEVGLWNWLKVYLLSAGFHPVTAAGIVSYGFALGMLCGRLAASRLLLRTPPAALLLACSVLIAATTFAALYFSSVVCVTLAVFAAGFAMAPVFPTSLALAASQYPKASGTAIGAAITSGWLGLAVSSPVIGIIASRSGLHHALLLLPGLAFAMVLVNLVLLQALRNSVSS